MGFAVKGNGIVKTIGSDPLGLLTAKASPNTPVAKQFTQRLGTLGNKSWDVPLANIAEVQKAAYAIGPWLLPEEACAVSGWLGGGGSDVPGKFWGTAHLDVDDINVECMGKSIDLNHSLFLLRKRNPYAHRWVVAKGFAKAIQQNNNMQRNVDEDTAAFWNKVGSWVFSWKGGVIPLVVAGVLIWKFAGRGGGRSKS
tara:strand:+ start:336 stop:926 length:591 start_codon:yes stop_codon:yes gene_type:complete